MAMRDEPFCGLGRKSLLRPVTLSRPTADEILSAAQRQAKTRERNRILAVLKSMADASESEAVKVAFRLAAQKIGEG